MKNLTDKNPKGDCGDTPLHHAANFGDLRLFKFIKFNAIGKNPRNDGGETPLYFAAHDCTAQKLKSMPL